MNASQARPTGVMLAGRDGSSTAIGGGSEIDAEPPGPAVNRWPFDKSQVRQILLPAIRRTDRLKLSYGVIVDWGAYMRVVLTAFALWILSANATAAELERETLAPDDGWAAFGTGTTGGALAADDHVFYVVVTDGQLNIRFVARTGFGQPIINALQVMHRPDR